MTVQITPDQLTDAMPFARALGVEIDTAGPDEVTGHLDWAPDRCTAGGVMHGGALMALADTLGAACAFLNLPPDTSTTTLESKTNFFRGVKDGQVRGVSRPLHAGRTSIVVQTDLFDAAGRRVAQVTQTQAVLRP
ncbi:PaaI family thioesterase [Actinomadura madurae]|uniref:PaaI family thioesterase n=1 Tax=Actinomadura madurae TaxID=1993 RepID=UPI002026DF50|nr:PaaI family thioesterase [Actinomadura madurae]MCP9947413.1 PaaI family thioesterase [Actinomadura madurae]URN03803.1 PaaI family thioesterase [Actinomadura madurae]